MLIQPVDVLCDSELYELLGFCQIEVLQVDKNSSPDLPRVLEVCRRGNQRIHDVLKTSFSSENRFITLLARRLPATDLMADIALESKSQSRKGLDRLIVWKSGFSDKQALLVASQLSTYQVRLRLKSLHIPHNRLSAAGARVLALGGLLHDYLHTMDLSHNAIGDHGAECLAWLAARSTQLRVLLLAGNAIGDPGAAALAGSLTPPTTSERVSSSFNACRLETLGLRENLIGDKGAAALVLAIVAGHPTLRRLDASRNPITQELQRRLQVAIGNCHRAPAVAARSTARKPGPGVEGRAPRRSQSS